MAEQGAKTFVVLGMHRSATSLSAMGLSRSNVHIGDNLLGADASSNPYGHYEDRDFIRMNQIILRQAGGSWDNPPDEMAILGAGKRLTPQIAQFIKKKIRKPFWGWKDPRTTLTIKCYLPYLPEPHFICNFRDPMQVAKSLKKRDGFTIERGLKLAATYNSRLINFLTEFSNKEVLP